ncbi:MAG: hypothetical protein IJX65_06575 [Alistipes sp.]|nr:hypothetical protein [Alistipes sp.]
MEQWSISNGVTSRYNTDERPLYIYQRMRAYGGCIAELAAHLEIVKSTYRAIFGEECSLTVARVESQCATLLKRGGYSEGSVHIVELRYDRNDNLSLRVLETSLYKHFSLRAVRPKAFECNISGGELMLHTSAAIAMQELLSSIAHQNGCDIPLCVDSNGRVTSVDGASPIITSGRNIAISHTIDSVEARATIKALKRVKGYTLTFKNITIEDIRSADEFFYADHRGITAVHSFEGHLYSDNIANVVIDTISF